MEQGPLEETLIRRARSERKAVPVKITDAPTIWPGLSFYFNAFIMLSSCRPLGMSEGRIPWIAAFQYAECIGLDEEEFDDMWALVSMMDGEYLKFRQKQTENKRAANAAQPQK